jgi:hypothetical protein
MSSAIDYGKFSGEVRAELARAGWRPERGVPVDDWVSHLAGQGYQLSAVAERMLRVFGGLSLGPLNKSGPNFTNDEPLIFDPVSAGSGHHSLAVELAGALGGNWYPLGEWLSSSSVFVEDAG